jgi:hypothetical protein
VEYVVDLKRLAEQHRFFQRLNSSGHKGSAPVNMSPASTNAHGAGKRVQRAPLYSALCASASTSTRCASLPRARTPPRQSRASAMWRAPAAPPSLVWTDWPR